MRAALETDGLAIRAFGSFQVAEERRVARITPESLQAAVLKVGRSAPCDGVFVSCTNARTLDIIATCEQALGVPVLSSTQVLAWHMLRLAGVDHRPAGFGRLFQH